MRLSAILAILVGLSAGALLPAQTEPTTAPSEAPPPADSADQSKEGKEDAEEVELTPYQKREFFLKYHVPRGFKYTYRDQFPWFNEQKKTSRKLTREERLAQAKATRTLRRALIPLPAYSLKQIEPSEALWEEKMKKAQEALEKEEYEEAEPLVQAVLDEAQNLKSSKKQMRLAVSLDLRAYLYAHQNLLLDAERVAQQAVKICKEQLGADSLHTVSAQMRLASIVASTRRFDEAVGIFIDAKRALVRMGGRSHAGIPKINKQISRIYMEQKDYDKAAAMFSDDLAIARKNLRFDDPKLIEPLGELVRVRLAQNRVDTAKRHLLEIIDIIERLGGPKNPGLAGPLQTLAEIQLHQKQPKAAEASVLRALAVVEVSATEDVDNPALPRALEAAARLQIRTGPSEQTREMVRRAVSLKEKALGLDHVDVAHTLTEFAPLFEGEEAERMLVRAVGIYSVTTSAQDERNREALYRLQMYYLEQRDPARAQQVAERLLQVTIAATSREDPATINQLATLGLIYLDVGNFEAAKQTFDYTLQFGRQAQAPGRVMAVPTYGLATMHHYNAN